MFYSIYFRSVPFRSICLFIWLVCYNYAWHVFQLLPAQPSPTKTQPQRMCRRLTHTYMVSFLVALLLFMDYIYIYNRCENCKIMAPTMELLHREYAGKVNFIMVNGDSRDAWPLIDRLGVDAIPHMAMISAEGDVETALIGLVPKYAIVADLNTLLENAAWMSSSSSASSSGSGSGSGRSGSGSGSGDDGSGDGQPHIKKELPAQMLDVFATKPELRRVSFPVEEL